MKVSHFAAAPVLLAVVLSAVGGALSFGGAGAAADQADADRGQSAGALRPLAGRIVLGQIPVSAGSARDGAAAIVASDESLPRRSRIVSLDLADNGRAITNLTPGFAAAGRPRVSFDAKYTLFVGKQQAGDAFAVWELDPASGGVRQVTDRPANALAAIYLHTVYLSDSDRPEPRIAFLEADRPGGPASLFTCRLDGSDVLRITFNPYGVSDPLLLSDGRLLYSSRCGPDPASGEDGGSALFTIFPDGADVALFAGGNLEEARRHEGEGDQGGSLNEARREDGGGVIRGMACELRDGRVVFVESNAGSPHSGGMLVSVDRRRSLHTRRVLVSDSEGLFRSPQPLNENLLLVSSRGVEGGSYGVIAVDSMHGKRVAEVFDDPAWHDVDAVILKERPAPAGRSSAVNRTNRVGWLYCMNAYMTGQGGQAGDPTNSEGDRKIAKVQVMVPDSDFEEGAGPLVEKLLGEAPVEADGSFHVQLPSRTPFQLKTLDQNGAVLQAMRSWIWVMPREARGCIGCHEDRELTPPNRHVMALRRAATIIGGATEQAMNGQESPAGGGSQ